MFYLNIRTYSCANINISHYAQIAAGDYHCAALTSNGELYTMGSKENGKLGQGSSSSASSRNTSTVGKVEKFYGADESTQLNDVAIGYVSSVHLTRAYTHKHTTSNTTCTHIRTHTHTHAHTLDISCMQVSCGQCFTLAITKDGCQVFGFGKADASAFGNSRINGDHHHPFVRVT